MQYYLGNEYSAQGKQICYYKKSSYLPYIGKKKFLQISCGLISITFFLNLQLFI